MRPRQCGTIGLTLADHTMERIRARARARFARARARARARLRLVVLGLSHNIVPSLLTRRQKGVTY